MTHSINTFVFPLRPKNRELVVENKLLHSLEQYLHENNKEEVGFECLGYANLNEEVLRYKFKEFLIVPKNTVDKRFEHVCLRKNIHETKNYAELKGMKFLGTGHSRTFGIAKPTTVVLGKGLNDVEVLNICSEYTHVDPFGLIVARANDKFEYFIYWSEGLRYTHHSIPLIVK